MNVIKNSTFYICLILGLVGIILYFVDYFALIVFAGLGLIGFILVVIAWFLFILAVKTTGL
ncbi:MAG: hypothetical protein ACXACG_01135 [Candidatus Thorarchaeota archaeon]|jgi:hypothetical protein